MNKKEMKHIVGTFLIPAKGAFLNGAGIEKVGEDRNTVVPKQFSDGKYKVPYVSAQAWRRWLRNTLIEETGWPQSKLRAIGQSKKGTTNKISGELNPIEFPEDDIFGYMRASEGQGKTAKNEGDSEAEGEKKKGEKVKAIIRASPFKSSILVSLRKTGWKGKDEGYVHLEEGTPQPYSTVFYNTSLQGIFGLDLTRLGTFRNVGDRIEIEPKLVEKFKDRLEKRDNEEVYYLKDPSIKKERARALMNALVHLRGGAKLAAFAQDVTPKVIIFAGLDSGNLIFNHLFEDDPDKNAGPVLKIDTLLEIQKDYADRLATPIYIGIRTGFLDPKNEEDLRALVQEDSKFVLGSPVDVVKVFSENYLK